jgi:hypothetical protein
MTHDIKTPAAQVAVVVSPPGLSGCCHQILPIVERACRAALRASRPASDARGKSSALASETRTRSISREKKEPPLRAGERKVPRYDFLLLRV